MKTRFCIQHNTRVSTAIPCTQEMFNATLDSARVKQLCNQIAQCTDDDLRSSLKQQLPAFCWHAGHFRDDKRKADGATPSGLAMLDVDHVSLTTTPSPEGEENEVICTMTDENGHSTEIKRSIAQQLRVALIAITPSTHGLRIVAERQCSASGQWEDIPTAQARIAREFHISAYDAVTKDLARLSFAVPRDYVLYMNEEVLFGLSPDPSPEREGREGSGVVSSGNPLPDTTTDTNTTTLYHKSPPSGGDLEGAPLFKGIPYADIVTQLMNQIGANGGAEKGERNTVYFSLANYMRYICDFNADTMLSILPDFGLTQQERRNAIQSAIGRPRKDYLPTILQTAISLCEKDMEVGQTQTQALSYEMKLPMLPPLLRTICKRLPEQFRPAMIIAALPVLGTLATRIRFEYLDRQVHSLSFFSCITAPAASGKSFIRKPIDLLLTPINEQDAIEREKEQAYKEKLRANKNSKNQPEDPKACPRNNGVSVSIAKLLQLLTYSEGKHLIGIGEEMDTLVKSEKAGVWSQKSDIYRLAFDNAEYGQAYMSDTSFSAHIPVYYNLMLTGTPNSMRRFFKDLENGLATRVCFAQLPDTSFSDIPIFAPYTEKEKEEIIRWARVLDKEQGMIACPQVEKVISKWLETKRQEAIDADSHAADTLRRRSAVIGYRAGMLCWLLEGHRWTNVVSNFTEWVAEYVFRNQMELWGEAMEKELTGNIESSEGANGVSSLLAYLPTDFTTGDLIKLRARKGQSVKTSSINMLLSRWKQSGRIEKKGDGNWRKLV